MKELLRQYKKTILLWTIVFAVGVPLLAYGIGRFQFHKAEKKVEQKVGAESFLLDFSSPAVIDSQSALLTQLWNLIDQEEKTRTAINNAYGFTEEDYSQLKQDVIRRKHFSSFQEYQEFFATVDYPAEIIEMVESDKPGGTDASDEIYSFVLKDRWCLLRGRLAADSREALDKIFETAGQSGAALTYFDADGEKKADSAYETVARVRRALAGKQYKKVRHKLTRI